MTAVLALDHLIVAGPDLAAVVDHVAGLTGARAVAGGRHTGQGTHNALLGLGPGRYLELLAPDPAGGRGGFRDSIAYLEAPALHTWCVRGGVAGHASGADRPLDAEAFARRVAAAGCTPRRLAMSRSRPDGVTLRWELVFVEGHPYAGLLPFFIDWQGSPHPSTTLPARLAWRGLSLAHPDAAGLGALLADLGGVPGGVRVTPAAAPALVAAWRGPGGDAVSSGRGGPG